MKGKGKKLFGILLAWALVFTSFAGNLTGLNVAASTVTSPAAAVEAGLQTDPQDGVTLQCWNWSYDNIAANMEKIAGLGYSAIQTSPIQQAKESTTGRTVGSYWWLYYQPATFTIDNTGTSALGTKQDFEDMCEVAHQYGVKVIVDIVANHMGNQTSNNLATNITSDLRNDSSCWHDITTNISDYSSRYNITQYCMGGLPDLNTSNTKVQNYVLSYLKECIDAGADGFRFDAAKHIETPDDSTSGCASNFWPTVINGATSYASSSRGIDLYCYGEILDQPDSKGTLSISSYTKYMSVTDNQQGNALRNYVNSNNASGAGSSYYYKSTTANKLVLWAESHDTYADNASSGVSTYNINKTWALVAARADAMGLYFARPNSTSTVLGTADTTGWSYNEVGVVNKFHNAFVGQTEYVSSEGNIAYCERGTTGVVLVNCNGSSASVSVTAHKMASGTYKDQVSGNTFTVSGGKISGTIGDKGYAVVYNINSSPSVSISKESGTFSSDTLSLTATLSNATSGTYQIGSNSAVSYTGSATFSIGSGMSVGDSVTVKLTATNGTTTATKEYTYQKVEKSNNIAYLKLPSSWGTTVYCYAYDSATETVKNAAWPGVLMTSLGNGIYKYEVPDTIESPRVIFYNSATNRYPADSQKGLLLSGSMIYSDGTWTTYMATTTGTVTANYVDTDGNTIATAVTTTGDTGTSYTTSAKTISGYTLSSVQGSESGTYTSGSITVTYTYTKNATVANIAYISKPSGWGSALYCYVYSADSSSNRNAAWPGVAMTLVSGSTYKYEVSSSITNPLVIFTDGTNQYPAANKAGLSLSGSMIYKDGTWGTYTATTTGTVMANYVDTDGNTIATAVTTTGDTGTSYTTSAKTISGYTLSSVQGSESGTYTSGSITVTYIYAKSTTTTNVAYITKPSGWGSTIYCYAYSADSSSNRNAAWPGVAMTLVSGSTYKYEVSSSITNPLVIFTDGTNQYPAANKAGLSLSGSMIYQNGSWSTYTEGTTVTTANVAYIAKSSSWGSTIYCYAYSSDNESNKNAAWPGVAMTLVSGNIYKYEVSSSITNPRVIFTDGTNQYPGANQAGLLLSGTMIYQNSTWSTYTP